MQVRLHLEFQSLRMQGATNNPQQLQDAISISTTPPCRERQKQLQGGWSDNRFQSTPYAGSDAEPVVTPSTSSEFQSTLPMQGATTGNNVSSTNCVNFNPPAPCTERLYPQGHASNCKDFNPRSPCRERRLFLPFLLLVACHFNPRSPCRERLMRIDTNLTVVPFQSTLPMQGATNL